MTEETDGDTGTQYTAELKVERTGRDVRGWSERRAEEGMEDSWKLMDRG